MSLPLLVLAAALPAALAAPDGSAPPPATAASPLEVHTLAVPKLRLESSVAESAGRILDEVLLATLAKYRNLKVLGASDIVAMLERQAQQQFLGCESNESCLAEISGALGASLLLDGSVGAVGDEYVLSLKLIDANASAVLGRASETIGTDPARLVAGVPEVVSRVMKAAAISGTPRGDAIAASLGFEPISRLRQLSPWIATGVTGVLLATGAVFGGMARRDAGLAGDRVRGTPAWKDKRDAAQREAVVADSLFLAGALAGLGTGFLFWWNRDAEGGIITNLSVGPSGASTSIMLSW
jgi:hypothetical protein